MADWTKRLPLAWVLKTFPLLCSDLGHSPLFSNSLFSWSCRTFLASKLWTPQTRRSFTSTARQTSPPRAVTTTTLQHKCLSKLSHSPRLLFGYVSPQNFLTSSKYFFSLFFTLYCILIWLNIHFHPFILPNVTFFFIIFFMPLSPSCHYARSNMFSLSHAFISLALQPTYLFLMHSYLFLMPSYLFLMPSFLFLMPSYLFLMPSYLFLMPPSHLLFSLSYPFTSPVSIGTNIWQWTYFTFEPKRTELDPD